MREPLVPWLAIGMVVVGGELWRGPMQDPVSEPDDAVLVVDETVRDRLALELAQSRGETPSETEVAAAVEAWVREELLLREARRLGLDETDAVIRERLVSQALFVLQGLEAPPTPDEQALRDLYATMAQELATPARWTLEHRVAASEEAARDLALAMQRGEQLPTRTVPRSGPVLRGRSLAHLERQLGPQAAAVVQPLRAGELGIARGPEGWHVLRVAEHQDATMPSFEQARGRVMVRWVHDWTASAEDVAVERLLDEVEVLGWP
ncbi:MAG: peptidyl-prolyl cis-trans isomerase [Myxococcota bacterium]